MIARIERIRGNYTTGLSIGRSSLSTLEEKDASQSATADVDEHQRLVVAILPLRPRLNRVVELTI